MSGIKQQKLSDVITDRLEAMILDGSFVAGEKLPAERVLAADFNVSRPSLREAIQNLQAKGLVERKQGGGTFVNAKLNANMTEPLLALIAQRPETQFDLLEFRHALEGMAAFYSALRGQPEDYPGWRCSPQRKNFEYHDCGDDRRHGFGCSREEGQ